MKDYLYKDIQTNALVRVVRQVNFDTFLVRTIPQGKRYLVNRERLQPVKLICDH